MLSKNEMLFKNNDKLTHFIDKNAVEFARYLYKMILNFLKRHPKNDFTILWHELPLYQSWTGDVYGFIWICRKREHNSSFFPKMASIAFIIPSTYEYYFLAPCMFAHSLIPQYLNGIIFIVEWSPWFCYCYVFSLYFFSPNYELWYTWESIL